jgi:hypothetical protein
MQTGMFEHRNAGNSMKIAIVCENRFRPCCNFTEPASCLRRFGKLQLFTEQQEDPVQEINPMSAFVCAVSAMSVALLYSTWRAHHEKLGMRQKQLRERVTYMLWCMANNVPERE